MALDNFDSGEHALVGGMVWGIAAAHGLELTPIIDADGDYTPRYELKSNRLPPGVRVFINIEAPEITPPDKRPF